MTVLYIEILLLVCVYGMVNLIFSSLTLYLTKRRKGVKTPSIQTRGKKQSSHIIFKVAKVIQEN